MLRHGVLLQVLQRNFDGRDEDESITMNQLATVPEIFNDSMES